MSICQVIQADSPTLKRSFDAARNLDIYPSCETLKRDDGKTFCVIPNPFPSDRISRPSKRRPIPSSRSLAMPVQTSAPVSAAFPSFMSVFGGGMGSLQDDGREDTSAKDTRERTQYIVENTFQTHYPVSGPYQHRESAASINSDSTDSSPTTTISTFDSQSMTDPSPSSSPESPTSLLPLSPFSRRMGIQKPIDEAPKPTQPNMLFHAQPRSESPASKERNVKNLSLNMNASHTRSVTSSAVEGLHPFSAPTSPLRGPLKTGRRRPNNLTIQTPSFDKITFAACDVPPTPSHRPTLKHHESSPALPSLLSPTTAPLAGMQLPPIAMTRLLSRPGSASSFSSLSVSSQGLHDLKEEAAEIDGPLQSQEEQERGYSNGPVRIYDSGVYLYLEPSREEASSFDTVINVAKEVASPFSTHVAEPKTSIVSVWRNSEPSDLPEPQTAVSDRSFKSALEWPQFHRPTSPITPKARPSEPEYIHVPWDHNSEILDDLYSLCQIIDNRVSEGKKVLVHCQLGVSRSASLVIAYGLYKGFKTDFHSMYTAVKERSQWVGPNMSLIYQLMDFRTQVANGELAIAAKPASQDWFLNASTENEMTPRPVPVPTEVSHAPTFQPPSVESLRGLIGSKSSPDLPRSIPPVLLFDEGQAATRKVSLPRALSNFALSSPPAEPIQRSSSISPPTDAPPIPPKSTRRNAPQPLPLRERSHASGKPCEIPPHTPRDSSRDSFTLQPISFACVKMDLMMQDVPSTPSIFSPRTTEFRTMSFGLTDAGDLASETSQRKLGHGKRLSIFSQPQACLAVDPRSPHQGDQKTEIMRNIDDVL